MARDYTLDTDAAKDANSGGKRITESGPYVGIFTAAFYEQNERGTESVNLMFQAENGQEVGPMALYTHKGNGESLPGYKTFNALLTCLKLRDVKASEGEVELYDFDAKAVVKRRKEVYRDITGKRVGVVLRREEYVNRNGETKERMTLFAPFCATSRRMADEILARADEGKALDRVIEWIEREPVKHVKGGKPAAQRGPSSDDVDDDSIPFN